ncbi:MAG TPA: hypothetical protein VGG79_00775 [Roseiarcus sp.]|jgi:hypothetical protein
MPRLAFKNISGPWHTNDFKSVSLTSVSWEGSSHPRAFVFFGHANIDFDGSPTAYGPRAPRPPTARIQPVNPPPDDCLHNGGNAADGYFGVAAMAPNDPLVLNGTVLLDTDAPKFHGKFPIVQQQQNGDPKPGYYVSRASHRHGPIHLQNSYISSADIAYGALDAKLLHLGVEFGDYGLALRHDQSLRSGFYYIDGGGSKFALGECSHKVAKNLGVTRIGGRDCSWDNNFPVSFMVFPGSGDMHYDAAAGQEIGFGIMDRDEDAILGALKPRLVELSRADNALDLARLMAFNEGLPTVAPNGKARLDAYHKRKGAPPAAFVPILTQLSQFGFWPFKDKPKEERDPFNPFDNPRSPPSSPVF